MQTVPPCIEYAKINGPVDEDEMAWGLNLAKFLKIQGFSMEKAAMHLARLALNGDQDEPMDEESILDICKLAWSSEVELSCSELMASVSFLRGCTRERCPEYDAPIVPPDNGPTMKRVYITDPAESVGVAEDGKVRQVKSIATKDGSKIVLQWVSDCPTYIHTETIADKQREFIFCGQGANDRLQVKFCMAAEDLADVRKFKAAMINSFGAANRIGFLNFETVQQITVNTIRRRRLTAPTWVDGAPMVPGCGMADDIEYRLLEMIPAEVHDGDLADAKEILGALLDIPGPTLILVTAIMGSPIYARWFLNDRFGVGLWGRTGSLKTSVAKKAMCVWGVGYNDDASLLKHGKSGSTAVGELEILAGAGFLPQIIDNVKSVDPRDAQQYIATIHAVIEGKDKVRGKKDGGIRNSKPFFCTPIVTGEIKPDEASTSARILNLQWTEPKSKDKVDFVQANIGVLPVVGYHWLRYLAFVLDPTPGFAEDRSQKTVEFNKLGYVNSGRLATIYALLRLTWDLLADEHAPFGDVFRSRTSRFHDALDTACEAQGLMVSEETEVAKFMAGIKAILASQPHLIQQYENQMPDEYGKTYFKDVIGRWVNRKTSPEVRDLFLVPEPTLNSLKRLGVFTQIPTQGSITDALSQAGFLVEQKSKRRRVQQPMNGHKVYGWQIRGEVFIYPEESETLLEGAFFRGEKHHEE
jgi:hypothetical protein